MVKISLTPKPIARFSLFSSNPWYCLSGYMTRASAPAARQPPLILGRKPNAWAGSWAVPQG
jgi:hypothetical protein